MITQDELIRRKAEYERQEQQALADANAAHGAIVAIDSLLQLLADRDNALGDALSLSVENEQKGA